MAKTTAKNAGFTLLEVMIGSALVVTLAVGLIGVKVFVNQAASDTTTRRDAYRIAELAMNEAIKNDRFILPQDYPSSNTWFFKDDAHSSTLCLDSNGKIIPWKPIKTVTNPPLTERQDPATNTECPFMVSYFKVQEVDRLLTDDLDAARIPISRYRMKVRYRIRAANPIHPLDPKKDFDIMEVSRLVTHVIPF